MHAPPRNATVCPPIRHCKRQRRPWTALRWIAALAIAAGVGAAVLTTETAQAQSAEVVANVIALDQGRLMVDLSASKGATVGATVELWRPVKLTHPVNGRILMDRYPIGSLRLTHVGPTLSVAVPSGALERDALPGDVVILRNAVAPVVQTTAPHPVNTPAAKAPAAQASVAICVREGSSEGSREGSNDEPLQGEAKVLSDMFDALKGADPVKRIRAYEDYVRSRPRGRYSRVLWEEAQALRKSLEPPAKPAPTRTAEAESEATRNQQASTKTTAAEPSKPAEDKLEVRGFTGPQSALSDTPLSFGMELNGPAAGALLHVRKSGSPAYATFPMKRQGQGYFEAELAPSVMQVGAQDYFIEGVKRDGRTVPLVGDAEAPATLVVDALPSPRAPKKHAYAASIWTDYASYNVKKRNDWASQSEGFVGMRFGNTGLRALRSGFGVYRGAGGSIRDLDELDKSPRAIGLTYGYLETELGVSNFVSFLGRGIIGLRDSGLSGGAQLMLRIGNDRKTNLQIGGEVLGGVGLRGITQLELNTFPKVPILFRTEVSNQPAGMEDDSPRPTQSGIPASEVSRSTAEIGVRGVAQVGYRFAPSLAVSIRGSYQGRTINHSGPGAGAGITYEW